MFLILSFAITFAQEYKVTRTETAPVIDGIPNDKVWNDAAILNDLHQNTPVYNNPPSERTEIRVLYDHENLYILFSCFDKNPEKIDVQKTARDQDFQLGSNPPWDNISFIIDSNLDMWTAYMFSLTVLNTQSDATIAGKGSNNDYAWDANWISGTSKTNEGWFAEISLPFCEINFSCEKERGLRINFDREIPRKHETIYWVNTPRNSWWRSRLTGLLSGISDIQQKREITFETSVSGSKERLDMYGSDQFSQKTDVGMQIHYNPLQQLSVTLALNPDFSQIEVDEYSINPSRYSVYVKERRTIFVRNSEFFTTPIPVFHSRRIGEQGDVIGGIKAFGAFGKFSYGIISAITGDWNYFDLEPKDSSIKDNVYNILRMKYNLINDLNVGVLFANQHENKDNYNRAYSFDLTYRNLKNYFLNAQMARSEMKDKKKDNLAMKIDVGKEGSLWNYQLGYEEYKKDFNIDNIGFYSYQAGVGYNRYCAGWDVNPFLKNNKLIYNWEFSQEIAIQKDTDKDDHSVGLFNELTTQFGNYWVFGITHSYTNESVLDYNDDESTHKLEEYGINVSSDMQKRISADVDIRYGDYYNWKKYEDGKIFQTAVRTALRPLTSLKLSFEYETIRIFDEDREKRFENLNKIIGRSEIVPFKNTFLRFLFQKQITKTTYSDPYIDDVDTDLNNINSVLGYKFNIRTTVYLTGNYYWYLNSDDSYKTFGVKVSHIWQ